MNHAIDVRWEVLRNCDNLPWLPFTARLVFIGLLGLLTSVSIQPNTSRTVFAFQKRTWWQSDFFYASIVFLFLIAGRWPVLLPGELDVDESQYIAGAHKLCAEPVYWKSLETGSAGPLVVYPLVIPSWFGIRIEYATTRMFGICLIVFICLSLYFSLKILSSVEVARLAALPVVTSCGAMQSGTLVHYNSEHMVSALLAGCLWMFCRMFKENRLPAFLDLMGFGVILGIAPYAKLQSVPILFGLGCMCLDFLWKQSRSLQELSLRVLLVSSGCALFSVLNIAIAWCYSADGDFIKNYVIQNMVYVELERNGDRGVALALRIFSESRGLWGLCLLTVATMLIGCLALFERSGIPPVEDCTQPDEQRRRRTADAIGYGFVLVACAIYSILKPGKSFSHYTILLLIPCGFLIGAVLRWAAEANAEYGSDYRVSRGVFSSASLGVYSWLAFGVVFVSLLVCGRGVLTNHKFLHRISEYRRDYLCSAAQRILELTTPGERIAIWGWSPGLYVQTDLVQATRESNTAWSSLHTPLQGYFVKRFVADAQRSNPKLFIDAQFASPLTSSFFVDSYLSQREISDWVEAQYLFSDEIERFRIFKRRD